MLTIGILADDRVQEGWAPVALERVGALPDVRLKTIAIATRRRRMDVATILHRGIDTVDKAVRCRREPLFERNGIVERLQLPALDVRGKTVDKEWILDDAACRTLRAADVDLWICTSRARPTLADRHICRYGVWGVEIGRGVSGTDPWAGAMEVAYRSPVTAITVRDYSGEDEGRVLMRSFSGTDRHSARRNRLRALRKASGFLERLVTRLRSGKGFRLAPRFPAAYPQGRRPTVMRALRIAYSLVQRIANNQLRSLRWRAQWQIAYYFGSERAQSAGVERLRYLVPPPDRFWADPMAVLHEGRHFIFFEEMSFKGGGGRLMAVEVFQDAMPAEPVVVLERPYHLSYPFVFRWQDQWYMVPETAESGRVELYRCVRFPDQWTFDRALLSDIVAYDATLWQAKDRWWMFVSIALPGTADGDELHLYHATTPKGPWQPHSGNPVMSDARFSRPAGPVYSVGDKVYRPSQDCSTAYGYAVSINRINSLDDESYRETPVAAITPDKRNNFLCVHTVGNAGKLHVLDFQVFREKHQPFDRSAS